MTAADPPRPCTTAGCENPATVTGTFDSDDHHEDGVAYCDECAVAMTKAGMYVRDDTAATTEVTHYLSARDGALVVEIDAPAATRIRVFVNDWPVATTVVPQ